MNYARSETAAAVMDALYRARQREAEKRANNPYRNREPALTVGVFGDESFESLIPLARFADFITTSTIIEIAQTDKDIQVTRNQDFTLGCDFPGAGADVVETQLGNETCAWDGRDLVLRMALPGNLRILNRLTVGPDRKELRIATTVSSGSESRSFTLNKFFYRFEPPAEDFACRFTLTRGNVCSRKTP
jgi:hypothetical protein